MERGSNAMNESLADQLRRFNDTRAIHTRVINDLRHESRKEIAERAEREAEIAEQRTRDG